MNKIEQHPILDIPQSEEVVFEYNGHKVVGYKGYTIATALHRAGFTVHSHSIEDRERSLECGIGKCGACEMLVDGKIKRICITPVEGVKKVQEIPHDYLPELEEINPGDDFISFVLKVKANAFYQQFFIIYDQNLHCVPPIVA